MGSSRPGAAEKLRSGSNLSNTRARRAFPPPPPPQPPLPKMPEFFNRCEVRDITGETASVLFGQDNGSMDFGELRAGATLFVRYAC